MFLHGTTNWKLVFFSTIFGFKQVLHHVDE